jgi:hypothetical protein
MRRRAAESAIQALLVGVALSPVVALSAVPPTGFAASTGESFGGSPASAATASPTSADPIIRAAEALKNERLYVDPPASALLTPDQVSEIEALLDRAHTPIYVAVLPKSALEESGGNGTLLAAKIHKSAGSPPGTVAVLAGTTFAAGSTVLGKGAGDIAADTARRLTTPAERIAAFIAGIERAASRPPTAVADEPAVDHRSSSAFPIGWVVLLGVGLATFAWAAHWRRRRRDEQANGLRLVRGAIDADIITYGAALRELDSRLRVSTVDRRMRGAYGRALEAYERAKQAATRVHQLDHVEAVTRALEGGWYALACARAGLGGEPIPLRRPPCLFNPQHGPGTTEIVWTPGGADPRRVPACAEDARRISSGSPPNARMVRYSDGLRPYWETGAIYATWAQGWYAEHGRLLLATLLYGTPLGEIWDDPTMATAESPFDGWATDTAEA